MTKSRRAVIDVGTNSVKLLVADVEGREVRPVWEESTQTRLGSGFYESRRLQPEPVARTAAAAAQFAGVARRHGADSVSIIATSAAREALNAAELIAAIETAARLPVRVLTGDEEAEWVFRGVTTDPGLADRPLLLLDVGGGSTEFIVGRGTDLQFRTSVPLGTVRLLESLRPADPPGGAGLGAARDWVRDFLTRQVQPLLDPALRAAEQAGPKLSLVGTGGSTTLLARMQTGMLDFDRARIEATRLSLADIRRQVEHLWSLPLEARRRVLGLPPNRADVILTGVVIYEAILGQFDFQELRVSTRGLRFAAVLPG
ncbi:MAG: Ppx/GppA family phosphatase [Verrucomicrobiota bacterium]